MSSDIPLKAMLQKYRIIFPAEHGSWSMTLVPFIIGAGMAGGNPGTHATVSALLALITIMGLFLARQPLTLWQRIHRGKGRRSQLPTARFWSAVLLGLTGLAGLGLLLLGRLAILWLAIPAGVGLALTLLLTAKLGPRKLGIELLGVTVLALAAPAATISAVGRVDTAAWLAWGISAMHSVISVLYVRLRVDVQHRRETPRQAGWVIAAHVVSLLALGGVIALRLLPWPVLLPVGLLLARALIAAWRKPAIDDVRRFGFTEMGLGLAFALLVIVAYLW